MPLILVEHPLLQHKLARLRSKETNSERFRQLVAELSTQLFAESCRDLVTQSGNVVTPFAETEGQFVEAKITLIPILRAGIGMQEGIQKFWPDCAVGHLGI